MIVLDASAVIEWLLGLPRSEAIAERITDADQHIHVPHLLAVEVAQVIRRFEARGEISDVRASAALEDLADLGATRHEHEALLPIVWQLRHNLTAYDAVYVALALALEAPLLTLDERLANAPHGAEVELVG